MIKMHKNDGFQA